MHNYHDVHRTLPFGVGTPILSPRRALGPRSSCLHRAADVYALFNFKLAMNDPANAAAVAALVPTYVCPTTPRETKRFLPPTTCNSIRPSPGAVVSRFDRADHDGRLPVLREPEFQLRQLLLPRLEFWHRPFFGCHAGLSGR